MTGAWLQVDPDAAGNAAMRYWVTEGLEQHADRLGIEVRLWQVLFGKAGHLLVSCRVEVAAVEVYEVLQR